MAGGFGGKKVIHDEHTCKESSRERERQTEGAYSIEHIIDHVMYEGEEGLKVCDGRGA